MREYYVEISALNSTTKLGKLLTERVKERYDDALLTNQQAGRITEWLEEQISRLCKANKRLTPMKVKIHGSFNGGPVDIYTVTENGTKAFGDNRPFTIHLRPVKRNHTFRPNYLETYSDSDIISVACHAMASARAVIDTMLAVVDFPLNKNSLRVMTDIIDDTMMELVKSEGEPSRTLRIKK